MYFSIVPLQNKNRLLNSNVEKLHNTKEIHIKLLEWKIVIF